MWIRRRGFVGEFLRSRRVTKCVIKLIVVAIIWFLVRTFVFVIWASVRINLHNPRPLASLWSIRGRNRRD